MDSKTIKRYAKFVVAAAGAVGIVASQVASGQLDSVGGWVDVAIAVAAALGVRQARNAR